MDSMASDFSGTAAYLDDIIVAGALSRNFKNMSSHYFRICRKKTVDHASQTPTTAEKNWSQIEKESRILHNFKHQLILNYAMQIITIKLYRQKCAQGYDHEGELDIY
ncbi:hypothetical protein ACTXT7_012333 [Hymenolepis weldensis]